MLILRSFFGAANLGRLIPVRRFTKGSSRLFDLDIEFYCNPQNRHVIEENLNRRGYEADLDQLSKLWDELKVKPESNERLRLDLLRAVARLPNATHPDVLANATGNPVTVETVGEKPASTSCRDALKCS
uniref:Putative seryl-trna synthetase n=1 Tax=Ixodes ricinus TaxID=34613 RepID=A0A0K8R3P9_IXORI